MKPPIYRSPYITLFDVALAVAIDRHILVVHTRKFLFSTNEPRCELCGKNAAAVFISKWDENLDMEIDPVDTYFTCACKKCYEENGGQLCSPVLAYGGKPQPDFKHLQDWLHISVKF